MSTIRFVHSRSDYDGALADDLIESMQDYNQMLKVTGNEWPVDQPLQTLIDYRIERDETDDKLPSSEEIAERESLKEDGLNDDAAPEPSDEAKPADSEADKAEADKADADKADANQAKDGTTQQP